jgi:hypothetical protein
MGKQLRIGDRVRVKQANRLHGRGVGETGRVVWMTPRAGPADGAALVHCARDRVGSGYLMFFHLDEIERVP